MQQNICLKAIKLTRYTGISPLSLTRQFNTSAILRHDPFTVHVKNTNRFRQLLEDQGELTPKQANAVVNIITEAIKGGVAHVSQDLASREKLTKLTYQQRVDFAKLKDQLLTADRSEIHAIQSEVERNRNDIEQLRNKLREEITKANAGFKLDISLEKGRIKEESSKHDLKIKEIQTGIEQQVSNMQTQIDSVKTQVMQWLIGVCTGTFALVLTYVRLLS
ncbi:HDL557Wp [Eremothecium sinecaudum]|uniref:HDL557Wp n=1 Tax=Eremothecium sinecaudum TaxID=45286 RepID=A0A0X8HRN7_9SACH|nr:HDL557Wp [Eremothecium sinecaudum]AMD20187.1 HDL557Wp [Eremothecium sinecaudum]